MKNAFFRLLSLTSIALILSLSACGPPTTAGTDNGATGSRATDSTAAPGRSEGGKSRPYSDRENLINPNNYDFFADFERHRTLPFNQEYLDSKGVTRISIAHYNDDDNEFGEDVNGQVKELSGSRTLAFDSNGRITLLEKERLAKGETWTKISVAYEYDAEGKLIRESVRDQAFDNVQNTVVELRYAEDGRLIERVDEKGLSNFYGYDDENEHTYQLNVSAGGSASVRVSGQVGDFPDETCLRIQDKILTLASKFVPYNKTKSLIKDVVFLEMDDRKTIRQVNMGSNGKIMGTVDHAYNEFDNLATERFLWEETLALFRTEKVFHYTASNDLKEMVWKKVRNNDDNSTELWRFGYTPEGVLSTFQVSSRIESGPELVKEFNVISIEMEDPDAAPAPSGVPGATPSS